jgi:hypothetical protein
MVTALQTAGTYIILCLNSTTAYWSLQDEVLEIWELFIIAIDRSQNCAKSYSPNYVVIVVVVVVSLRLIFSEEDRP